MARVPKVEPFDLSPAVRDVPGRAPKAAGATVDRELVRRAQGEDRGQGACAGGGIAGGGWGWWRSAPAKSFLAWRCM